jgi:hypothetical protein
MIPHQTLISRHSSYTGSGWMDGWMDGWMEYWIRFRATITLFLSTYEIGKERDKEHFSTSFLKISSSQVTQ